MILWIIFQFPTGGPTQVAGDGAGRGEFECAFTLSPRA